jgi:hypothetical protein
MVNVMTRCIAKYFSELKEEQKRDLEGSPVKGMIKCESLQHRIKRAFTHKSRGNQ